MMLQAVIFDLDGVLVDSESVWDQARRGVVADNGGSWKPEATSAMMGMSSSEWSRYLHDALGTELDPQEINAEVVQRVLDAYHHEVPALPGATDAVRRLARRWPLGLGSSANRPVIDAVLETTGLTDCFAATVSGDEVPRGKPAPDVYLAAAQKLGIDPSAAVAVEDSSNGLRSAAAAGMLVIAIPNREFPPADDALAQAGLVLGSIAELTPEAIERYTSGP